MNERMYNFLTRAFGEEKMSWLEKEISDNITACFEEIKNNDASFYDFFVKRPVYKKHMYGVCRNNYLDGLFKQTSDEVATNQFTAEEARTAYANLTPIITPKIKKEFKRQTDQIRAMEECKDLLLS